MSCVGEKRSWQYSTGAALRHWPGTMRLRALLRQINEDQLRVTMATAGADGRESPFQGTDYTRKK